MRVVLLNDTRSNDHIGCHLVMQNLVQLCSARGMDVVASVPNTRYDDLEFVQDHIRRFDLLIVNGEGTLHHDCTKAQSLCRAAEYAAGRGKATALINTVWQGNELLNSLLPAFQLVSVRESRSESEIARTGYRARVVPDLVFHTEIAVTDRRRGGSPIPRGSQRPRTAVIDSVDKKTMLHWAWRALLRGHGLFAMHPMTLERLARRPLLMRGLRWRSGFSPQLIGRNFAEQLGPFDRIISGRFHGCCLAMLLGIPVLGLPSNTHKIEGMFDDSGLGHAAIVDGGSRLEVEQRFRHVQAHQPDVDRYIAAARTQINQLFDDLARLAADARAA